MADTPLSDTGKDVEKAREVPDETPEEPPSRLVLCCKSVVSTVCQAFVQLVLSIVFLVIGIKYRNDCPAQDWIPIYLIVVGVGGLVIFMVTVFWNYYQQRKESVEKTGEYYDTGRCCKWLILMRYLIFAFMFLFTKAWFIGGSVLVYSVHGDISSDEKDPNYCNGTLYWFSFVTLTITWVILGIIILVACCGLCVASCVGATFLEDFENTYMLPWEKKSKAPQKAAEAQP